VRITLVERPGAPLVGGAVWRQQKLLSLPLVAGIIMVWASVSPWLHDPLGASMTLWQLPVDLGWQVRVPGLNYGSLCVATAVGSWFFTVLSYSRFTDRFRLSQLRYKSLICLVPVLFFFGQMLCCDFSSMARIVQHERQALLIQQLFLYPTVDQLIPLRPFVLHISTFWGRWQILIDQLDYGWLLSLLAFCLLALWERFDLGTTVRPSKKGAFLLPLGVVLLLALSFARASTGIVYEKLAQSALSAGAYEQALSLLDSARFFLPTLDDAAFYHLERGQALYYLSPQRPTSESQAYLAASDRAQRDFPDAFQRGYMLWIMSPSTPWIVDELGETLEAWVDSQQPLKLAANQALNYAQASLPWLQILERVDATNVYTLYLEGRIYYASHAYSTCISFLSHILPLSQEPAILSSVYTYLALSEMGLGDPAAGRTWLFRAISLDPGYRNNTARETLSGLH
jgi:tetratricopeptide (TPR) repeat protein